MASKQRHEGYLIIDNRCGPGITEEFIRSCGKDPANVGFAGEGKTLEVATITCSHCQQVLLLNPERKRNRGYCSKCDHYICDACETRKVLTGRCELVRKRVEEAQERDFLQIQRGNSLLFKE